MRENRTVRNSEGRFAGKPSWDADYGGVHTPSGEIVMGAGILSQAPVNKRARAKYSASRGNGNVCLAGSACARGAIPSIRMRLLHLENAFGEVCTSEYCLDAMSSLVLLITRSARLDADRVARLTGGIHDSGPAQEGLVPEPAAGCQGTSVQRAG